MERDHDDAPGPLVVCCPPHCPKCQGGEPTTFGRRGQVTLHQCRACGLRFKGVPVSAAELLEQLRIHRPEALRGVDEAAADTRPAPRARSPRRRRP